MPVMAARDDVFGMELSADFAVAVPSFLHVPDNADNLLLSFVQDEFIRLVRVDSVAVWGNGANLAVIGLVTQHSGLCAGRYDLTLIFGQCL